VITEIGGIELSIERDETETIGETSKTDKINATDETKKIVEEDLLEWD
jgi:hypothetical protein